MANELKPQEVTIVIDQSLSGPADGQLANAKIAVDLNDAAKSGVAWQLAKNGASVLLEDVNKAPAPPDAPGLAQQDALAQVAGVQSFKDTAHSNPTIAFQNVPPQNLQAKPGRQFSARKKIAAGVVAATIAAVGITFYMTGDLANMYALLGIPEMVPPPPPPPIANTQNLAKIKPSAPNNPSQGSQHKSSPGSAASERDIWSIFANQMGAQALPRGTALTADQEASFKAGLRHEFHYQRYKTVLDLSALRASGSQELLREALSSEKFWTRMRALIALADMGEEITDEDVKQALGDAHAELQTRFFKRFEKSSCSAGCFFVARASMRYLDESGRAQIVKVVAREPSDAAEAFMVAATFDHDEVVRVTANELIANHNIDQSVWQDVKNKYGLAH